jgi:hypothetical protein
LIVKPFMPAAFRSLTMVCTSGSSGIAIQVQRFRVQRFRVQGSRRRWSRCQAPGRWLLAAGSDSATRLSSSKYAFGMRSGRK